MNHFRKLFFACLFAICISSHAALLSVDFSGNLYQLDIKNGDATFVGVTGFNRVNSAAVNSAGQIISVAESEFGGVSQVISIDPQTGHAIAVSPTFDTPNGVRAVAISSDDILYAIVDTGAPGSGGADSLYTIDPLNGTLNMIGATGSLHIQSLAIAPTGVLYAWDFATGLVEIDPETGSASLLRTNIWTPFIQSLEFTPDGLLFGVSVDTLYSIDLLNGQATVISEGTFTDMRGLAWVDATPIPLPAAFWLLSSGFIVMVSLGRRRRN